MDPKKTILKLFKVNFIEKIQNPYFQNIISLKILILEIF